MICLIIFSENLNVNDPLDGLYDPINRHKLPLAHVDVHPALKEACDDYISFLCVSNQPLGAHFLKILTVPPPAILAEGPPPSGHLPTSPPITTGLREAKEMPIPEITFPVKFESRKQLEAYSGAKKFLKTIFAMAKSFLL